MLLSIEKLIYGGDGLARTPADSNGRSMAVFVPFVLPGERIEADIQPEKTGFARGTTAQLIESSADRVRAVCRYFQRCGGCHYQHIPYDQQLNFKAEIFRETLQRIAKIKIERQLYLHPSPPWNYRNRTRLQVRTGTEFAVGYFRFGSREFLPIGECPISSPLINRMIARLLELRGSGCPPSIEEIELFADSADERVLAAAFCQADADESVLLRWAEELRRDLPEVTGITFFSPRRSSRNGSWPNSSSLNRPLPRSSVKQSVESLRLDPKALAQSGAKTIQYRTKDYEYQVGAGAFFQANRYLIDDLIGVVTGNASGESALDLYAGVGLFSKALAGNFHHIFAVEASQTAYGNLKQNVPGNVKAVEARTEDYLISDYFLSNYRRSESTRGKPDVVILDPPRAGAGKSVISSLVKLGAPQIRYVSCDPATLARDIVPLFASGYRIEQAHVFDLFPETFHIESVLFLTR